ncbi:MAG: hypothetical protein HYU41_12765 [Candidatus Rokubacteria bacterium]|nr:hypothetical protein [Candidatus Rokubacteria bacterium]
MRPRYDLKGGVRGKYQSGTPTETDSATVLRVWAPLIDFPWAGEDKHLTEDTQIRNASAYRGYESPDLELLAPLDRTECRDASHWLSVALPVHGMLSASESLNTFLLALWLVQPTRTQIKLRFMESPNDKPSVVRILDRFQWIRGQVSDADISDERLASLEGLLPRLRAAYLQGGRLRNALVLTFRACVSADWQAAFICWAGALESLLTYERGAGLTARLAAAHQRLLDCSGMPADDSVAQFKAMYDLRSTILHGRSYDRDQNADNLNDLAKCSDMVRGAWRAILVSSKSDELICVLESDDDVRKRFFTAGEASG